MIIATVSDTDATENPAIRTPVEGLTTYTVTFEAAVPKPVPFRVNTPPPRNNGELFVMVGNEYEKASVLTPVIESDVTDTYRSLPVPAGIVHCKVVAVGVPVMGQGLPLIDAVTVGLAPIKVRPEMVRMPPPVVAVDEAVTAMICGARLTL